MVLITKRFCIIGGVTFFLVIFLLNVFTPEYLDDYLYKYQFVNGVADKNYPIKDLSDIFRSQIEHYKVFNGRAIVHFFVQLFTGILGKSIFNVINTIVMFLFAYLIVKVSMVRFTVFRFILVNLLLLLLMPPFNACFLWMTGSINYLWAGCSAILYLYILLHLRNENLSLKYWFCGLFMLVLGWSHEGIAFPLALSSLIYYLFNLKKRFVLTPVFPFVLFFFLGSLLCTFSPATMSRGNFDSGLTLSTLCYKIYTGVCLIFRLKSFWLLVFMLLFAYFKRKITIVNFLRKNLIIVGAIVISVGIVLISGFSSSRAAFGLELYSFILSLKIFSMFRFHALLKKGIFAVYLCLMISILYYAFLGWKKNNILLTDIKQTSDGVIIYDELSTPSFFRPYILKPLESKNSVYYHAYSFSAWENKYIASTYGKDSLAFFPLKFIEKIRSTNTSGDFNIKDSLPFYYKQIDDNQNVVRVRYVLRKPLYTEIPLFYRPFAHRMERYSAHYIDTEDFDIQYIYGNRFLFVKKNSLLTDRLIRINIIN